jgi:hypothetical protein
MNDVSNIKQFKLVNGDEIICEVLEWATDETPDLVIRRALHLNVYDDDARGVRYYHFKPWMMMQEGDDVFLTLNTNHIVSEANPITKVLQNYYEAIKNAEMTEEEIAMKIDEHVADIKKRQALLKGALENDSDGFDNIIEFPFDPKKLH